MTRLPHALLAVTLVAVFIPGTALAKGASEATITGPGLDDPVSLAGEGQPGGEQLMQIAEAAGFFAAVFDRIPDPMLSERPPGDLGPRYTVTWVMPGPSGESDRIRQDLYPYAARGPVSYMAPGQPFFGTERTRGGWYVASSYLREALVEVGLPQDPPAVGGGDGFSWLLAGTVAVLVAALALGAAGAYATRRRPGAAATT